MPPLPQRPHARVRHAARGRCTLAQLVGQVPAGPGRGAAPPAAASPVLGGEVDRRTGRPAAAPRARPAAPRSRRRRRPRPAAGRPRAGTPTRSACRAVSSYSRARSRACPACRPRVRAASTSAGPWSGARAGLVEADQARPSRVADARARARRAAGRRRSPERATSWPGRRRPSRRRSPAAPRAAGRSSGHRPHPLRPARAASRPDGGGAQLLEQRRRTAPPTRSVCSAGVVGRRPSARASSSTSTRAAPRGAERRPAALDDHRRDVLPPRWPRPGRRRPAAACAPAASDSSGRPLRGQQLALVAPPRRRVEQRGPHQQRRAVVVPHLDGVEQAGQHRAVGADDVERDLPDRALHAQQRHRCVSVKTRPPMASRSWTAGRRAPSSAERPVHAQKVRLTLHDPAVGQRREVAAGRVLVQVGGVVDSSSRSSCARGPGPPSSASGPLTPAGRPGSRRVVSSGALRCGQWPVAAQLGEHAAGDVLVHVACPRPRGR